MLRHAMYQGYYVLDTFRCQAYQEEENIQAVSQSGWCPNFVIHNGSASPAATAKKDHKGLRRPRRCAARDENNGRLLIVVDIVGDLYEDLWKALLSLPTEHYKWSIYGSHGYHPTITTSKLMRFESFKLERRRGRPSDEWY
ncbi:hypothetical protein ZWY2020_005716 [Hordeum vulgare]|nr:hypothetical protein ZWY2020_005716 [Hordeum vulgare]